MEKKKDIVQYVWEKQSEGLKEIYKKIEDAFSIKHLEKYFWFNKKG